METILVNIADNGEITLVGKFNDGFAYLKCKQDGKYYTMRYPKLKTLTAEQAWDIYEFTGRVAETPFDVAVKFGVLYNKDGKEVPCS